jgi:hypothetical protein
MKVNFYLIVAKMMVRQVMMRNNLDHAKYSRVSELQTDTRNYCIGIICDERWKDNNVDDLTSVLCQLSYRNIYNMVTNDKEIGNMFLLDSDAEDKEHGF